MPAAWVAVASAVVAAAQQQDASGRASTAQTQAADKAIAAQNGQLGMTRADNAPFLATGTAANARLAQLLGIGDPNAQSRDAAAAAAGIKKPTMDDAATEHLGSHMKTFGTGYTSGSDMAAKDRQVKLIYDRMMQEYNDKVAAIAPNTGTPGGAVDSSFGSLTKKFTTADLNADPVYNSGLKFGLDRGTEGINSRALASGMYDSGATLKALTQFGNDYGSTKANESFNRYNVANDSIFNKLSGISGTGQVATNQVASAGTNAANNISENITGAGNARAAGIVGGANAWGNAATNANAGYNNYQSNKRLDALLEEQRRRNNGSSGNSQYYYTGDTAAGGNQYG